MDDLARLFFEHPVFFVCMAIGFAVIASGIPEKLLSEHKPMIDGADILAWNLHYEGNKFWGRMETTYAAGEANIGKRKISVNFPYVSGLRNRIVEVISAARSEDGKRMCFEICTLN